MNKITYSLIVLALFLFSCQSEDGPSPISNDDIAPGVVTIDKVRSTTIPGGVIVYYKIPADEDLLLVKAVYINPQGEQAVANSSVHNDNITIDVFKDTSPQTIKLVAVDKALNESQPVSYTFTPKEAFITSVNKTVNVKPTFGGLVLTAENKEGKFFGFDFFIEKDGEKKFYKDGYTSDENIELVIKLDSIMQYPIYYKMRDKHFNYTDVSKEFNIIPLEDTILTLKEHKLPNDPRWDHWEAEGQGAIMLDGDKSESNFSHTWETSAPWVYTMDIGEVKKLSRFKVFQRLDGDREWGGGNPLEYKIYGKVALTDDDGKPGDLRGWRDLGTFSNAQPSKSGLSTDDDNYRRDNGTEHFFSASKDTEVRYIRFVCTKVFNANYCHLSELEFYAAK